ncbi:unnamed protein product [Penicillium glandicola]
MGKLLVKLIGSGIDLASEAISSARKSHNSPSEYNAPSRDLTMDQSGEFVLTDEKTAGILVSGGYAELPAESHIHQQYAELPAGSETLLYGQYAELPANDEPIRHQNTQPPAVPAGLDIGPTAGNETTCENRDLPIPAKLYTDPSTNSETIYHETDQSIVPDNLHIQPVGNETIHHEHTDQSLVTEKLQTEHTEDQYPGSYKEIHPAPEMERDWDLYSESNYSVDLDREIDQTEEVWKLDETAHDLPPNYEESEFPPGVIYANEINQAQEGENMVRELVQMAGPVNYSRIPCPVLIPQRRPGNKYRGFVRAYAPILDNCGISSDLFLEFLENFYQASKTSGSLEVVGIAADIGYRQKAQITDHILQVVAGTIQSHDSNTFLGRVNQEIFMPRGLYAMVVEFKDQVPIQDQGALSLLSQKLGKTIFSIENVTTNQPASYTNDIRHPHSQIELPEVAPLTFPDLEQEAKDTESALEAPATRTSLVSRYQNYQNYKESSHDGKLISVLSGGKLGHKPSLIERATSSLKNLENSNPRRMSGPMRRHGNRSGLIEIAVTSFLEHRSAKRMSRDESRCGTKEQLQKNRGVNPSGPAKALQRNVQYLMIVNIPTREEMEGSLSQLDLLMQQSGSRASRGHWS